MHGENLQECYRNELMSQKEFLRESYCKLLEEYLDGLEKREHWGKTLQWKMEKFPKEAKEILELWAIIHRQKLDFLHETDRGGDVCEFFKLLEAGDAILNGKEYSTSLYICFLNVLEKC